MVRTRLVLLVTIAALLAPWVAPCFAAAPAGHAAMPCCRAAQGHGPVARPCCQPVNQGAATTPSAGPSLPQPAQTPAAAAPAISLGPASVRAPLDTAVAPIAARLRPVVLLI